MSTKNEKRNKECHVRIKENTYRDLKIIRAIYYTHMPFAEFIDKFLSGMIREYKVKAAKELAKNN